MGIVTERCVPWTVSSPGTRRHQVNSGSKLGTGRPATPLQSGLSAPTGLKQAPGLTDKGEERTQWRPSGDDKAH